MAGEGEGAAEGAGGNAPAEERPLRWYEGWHGGEQGDPRRTQWFKFLFPMALALAVPAALLPLMPWGRWLEWVGLAVAYLAFSYGKIAVVPVGVGLGFHPLSMAFLVLYVDLVCSLFVSWNFNLARRVPLLGHYIALIESRGASIFRGHIALQAGAWTAIALYVMLPFRGAGGITASVLGRGVGVRPPVVVSAVSVGAFTGAAVLAYASRGSIALIARDLAWGTISVLLAVEAVLLVVLLGRLVRIRRWERAGTGQ